MDWGPVPKLAERLGAYEPGRPVWQIPLRRYGVAEALGGPWDPYVQELPWPLALPPEAPEAPQGWLRLWRNLPGLLALLRLPRRRQDRKDPPDHAGLAMAIARCYTWLGKLAAGYLARLFAPFWGDLPSHFTAVSWRAVDWALAAWALDSYGPGILTSSWSPPTLDDSASLGDALCLHLHIEALVASLPERPRLRKVLAGPGQTQSDSDSEQRHAEPVEGAFASAPLRAQGARSGDGTSLGEVPDHRRFGGLRTKSFLTIYPALLDPASPRAARGWLSALNSLIRYSPITQMVYADLVDYDDLRQASPSDPALQPGNWAMVTGLPGDTEADPPCEGTDKDRRQHPGSGWGCELWYTHLARSLLGAVISQPPAFDALQSAEDEVRRLEDRKRSGRAEHRGTPFPHAGELDRARKRRARLRTLRATQVAERLRLVGSALASAHAFSAMTYLHVRLLDILLRYTVSLAMPAMLKEWDQADRSTNPRPRSLLFRPGGVCYDTFQDLLLGQPLDELAQLLDAGHRDMLREGLRGLLNRPDPLDARLLAEHTCVSEAGVQGLQVRFEREIELPLPSPLNRGPSPDQLLTDEWLDALLGQLPEQSVVEVT